MNFTSSDFQCPVTGIPVVLVWNEDTYVVTAKICSFIWEIWKENNPQNSDKEVEKETNKWCERFCGYAASIEEANKLQKSMIVGFN